MLTIAEKWLFVSDEQRAGRQFKFAFELMFRPYLEFQIFTNSMGGGWGIDTSYVSRDLILF